MEKPKNSKNRVPKIIGVILGSIGLIVLAGLVFIGREGHFGPFKDLAVSKIVSAYKKRPKGEIVFYGASNFTLWRSIEKDLAPYVLQNHGFGGSTDRDLVARAEELLFPFEPRIVVMQTGSNDLMMGSTVDELIAGKREMYGQFMKRLPNTVFVVMSGLPCPERASIWNDIQTINEALKVICDENEKMVYADADPLMLTADGGFRPELFSDGVHLNTDGRALWGPLIMEKLAEAEKILK
ncbi:MAG: GDSL-type esterase/lipase family protein [Clostridiales bacterium]|jgi:lysophospholipase L1-like esterase|nr:GDSL-type esterase/lipase family protein [Clostridiales bacterium]MDR2750788.1 GDSL-type esterase/lipase family protein [Clostridiales bacterium]